MRSTILAIPLLCASPALAETVDLTAAPIVDVDPIVITGHHAEAPPVAPRDVRTIRRWVEEHGRIIQRCLGRDRDAIAVVHRPVPVRLTLAPDGVVTADVWTGEIATERCIADAFAQRRFAPRPSPRPIVWTGVLHFGFDAPRTTYHEPEPIYIAGELAADDAAAAGGRAPWLRAPARLSPWRPRPDWARRAAGWRTVGWGLGDPSCGLQPTTERPVHRVRLLAQWVDGAIVRAEARGTSDPGGCRIVGGAAPHDDRDPIITARTADTVKLLGRGPWVTPGGATACCDGGWGALRPRVKARRRAVEACYRSRLIADPGLRGAVTLGLMVRDRSTAWTTTAARGRIATRVGIVADETEDEELARCVAAALESITLPPSALGHLEPRVGVRAVVRYTFERGPAEPGADAPAVPTLASWLIARGADADASTLLTQAKARSKTPRYTAGRAAVTVGRLDLAEMLFTWARDAAQVDGEPARALDAQLALAALARLSGDDADEAAILAEVEHAAELDAARAAAADDDILSAQLDGLIAREATLHHRALNRGGPAAARAGERAARMYRLWRTRADDGARRRPASGSFVGDARVLADLAHFVADRGDMMEGIALLDRWLALFPDAPERPRIIRDRRGFAEVVAHESDCRPASAAIDPPGSGGPTRPCPAWLDALLPPTPSP